MTEQTIFLSALDFPDAAKRSAYLDSACAGDAGLRQQVDALLAAHERSGQFLDDPAVAQMAAARPRTGEETVTVDANAAAGRDEDLGFLQTPTRPDSLGRLAHYEVLEVLGRGGFGTVLRAFDDHLHRMVAIKVLAPQLATSGTARSRFRREAKSGAAVRDEHVVHIYAVAEEDATIPYLVMEYIAGQTLQQKLDRTGPLPVHEILRIGSQVARGLAAAHATGHVHRDVKPSNILLENGVERAKLTDFGLARAADDASISHSGIVAGTPMYMSPEQAQGGQIDHRSDLFSLGSVLYAMCTGRPPFRASTTMAVLKRVCEEDPRPIREVNPETPDWLSDVIAKLHAKRPEDRFQSAQAVADLLQQHLAYLQHPAQTPMPPRVVIPAIPAAPHRAKGSRRLRPAVAILTPLLVCVVVATWLGGPLVRKARGTGLAGLDANDSAVSVEFRRISGDNEVSEEVAALIQLDGTGPKQVELPAGTYQARVILPDYKEVGVVSIHRWNQWNPFGENGLLGQLNMEFFRVDVTAGWKTQIHVLTAKADNSREQPGNWVQLFNGTDLTGWKTHPKQPGNWRVDNGILVGSGPKSHLFSEGGNFENFHLRIEAKINQLGDSGVYFWTPFDLDPSRGLPYGPELQLASSAHKSPAGTLMLDGPRPRTQAAPVPADDWFVLELIATSNHIVIKVDGITTTDCNLPFSSKGNFALQVYDPNTVVDFRKIEIRELPPATKSDHDLIQGNWVAPWGEPGSPDFDILSMTFTGDEVESTSRNGKATKAFFNLDPTKSPKQIVLQVYEGTKQTVWMRGIYKLEADGLTMCLSDVGGPAQFPADFRTGPESMFAVVHYRRDKGKGTLPPPVPTKAADVLSYLAGNWKLESLNRDAKSPPDKDPVVGTFAYSFVAGGKFLRGRSSAMPDKDGRPDKFALLDLWSFEPGKNTIRRWLAHSTGGTSRSTSGQFIPASRTLTTSDLGGNNQIVNHQYEFIDSNTFNHHFFVKEANGTIISEAHHKWTRVGGPVALPNMPLDPDRPDGVKVLDRLVGEWQNEFTVKAVKSSDKPKAEMTRGKSESVLGGRFVETIEGNDSYTLTWFDAGTTQYRQWCFGSAGTFCDFTGTWNADAKTMTWKSVSDIAVVSTEVFKSDNRLEFKHVLRAADGKTLIEIAGTSVRQARDVPRTAADVLPFMAGTWKVEKVDVEPKPPAGKAKAVGYVICDYVAGGTFLRKRGAFETETVDPKSRTPLDPGNEIPLMLCFYDPAKDVLTTWGAWSGGIAYGPVLGRFDPKSRSLLWLKTFPGGIQSTHQFNFIDADTITTRLYQQDETGKVVQEFHMTLTRIKGPVTIPNKPTDPKRPDQMKVLDRLVGEWRSEGTAKDAGRPDKPRGGRSRQKAQPILAGRFIEEIDTFEAENASHYSLFWFDEVAKLYHYWFFHSAGYFIDGSGTWDEDTKTLTWSSAGGKMEGRWVFKSDDEREFHHLFKDKDGKTLYEATGVSRRVASGWVPLFNGKDLTGWKPHPDQPGDWKVEDGHLATPGPASHLFSERGDYENFHLRVEAIVTEPGVFGIYYRSGFRFVGDTAESRHPPGYVAGFPVDDPVRIQQFREFFKPNEWFTLEVVADGSHRIEKYNGKTILDVVDKEPAFRKGHIVLRQLNNDSATFFRKIEIEELPASPPAPAPVLPDPGTAANLREQVGKTLSFQLVGSADGPIWGTDVYTADSRLATAAVHAGVLKVGQRGVVRVTVLPGMDLYQGKERHGVISNSYGSYPVSIRIDGATDASDAPPFVVLARPGKLERSFASFDELIAASDENDHFALRGLPDDPANEQVKKLRKELMEEYRVHYPARAGRVAAMLLALLGEVSPSVDQLQGTWKAVGCEAGGEKFHGAKFLPSQMDVRVTFTGTCVRYQWKLPKNLAAYKDELKPEFDGEFSVNVKAEPKRIAMLVLGEAKNSMIGSYRLEGNRLTVHWLPNPKDLNYPTSFETKAGDAAVVLVFERVTPPQTRTWWQVNYAEYDGKQFPDDEIKEWRVVTGGANRDRYIHVGFPEAQAGTFKLDVTKPIRPGVFPVDYAVTDGPHRGKTILGIWEYYGETMRICTAAPGNRNRPTLFLTSQGSGGWILVMKQFPLGRTNPTQEFGPPPRIVNDPPSKE